MTKKKRELIEIILDNVKPEDWPDSLPYAVYGKKASECYATSEMPISHVSYWAMNDKPKCKLLFSSSEAPRYWNKTIVHRDEFMNRLDERNNTVTNATTPPAQQEVHTEETKPCQQDENKLVRDLCGALLMDILNIEYPGKAKEFVLSEGITDCERSEILKTLEAPMKDSKQKLNGEFEPLESDGITLRYETMNIDSTSEAFKKFDEAAKKAFSIKQNSAAETQIGGDHYVNLAIQPMRYSMENKLDPLQHTIIKYVTRFRDKAGIEDLEKAKHCIDMLIEFEKESK